MLLLTKFSILGYFQRETLVGHARTWSYYARVVVKVEVLCYAWVMYLPVVDSLKYICNFLLVGLNSVLEKVNQVTNSSSSNQSFLLLIVLIKSNMQLYE